MLSTRPTYLMAGKHSALVQSIRNVRGYHGLEVRHRSRSSPHASLNADQPTCTTINRRYFYTRQTNKRAISIPFDEYDQHHLIDSSTPNPSVAASPRKARQEPGPQLLRASAVHESLRSTSAGRPVLSSPIHHQHLQSYYQRQLTLVLSPT